MNQERIWSYFQNQQPESFVQAESRLRFLVDQLPAGSVLNVGVGDGSFERLAASRKLNVHSIDPDEETVSRLAKIGVSEAKVGVIEDIPFEDNTFDAVVCSEVLEHLSDEILVKGLKEIFRVLRFGGELHGTVPADEDLKSSIVVCPKCSNVFHRWGHQQSFSVDRLTRMLQSIGNPVVKRKVFVHWPSLNWKGRVVATIRLLFVSVGVVGSGHNYYFKITKLSRG